MPKYIVTHWNRATRKTQEIIANSPEDAVISAGYSNEDSLQKCESRGVGSNWGSDKYEYYAGIREIYAIEYQCITINYLHIFMKFLTMILSGFIHLKL
jgi:hypothetical protein